MTTIRPIEARSIHQIQSGQVIVDLCSVVKELVENSLDAGATSIEVRFKNNGLDSIEVLDNGSGISPSNYENLALKHYTSKLSDYKDLSSLQTFGFRGEALSSLCALSSFYIITALAEEAPKGKRLNFEPSGKLKDVTVVAAQRGTTAVVEGLFDQLPVRRKELAKNIKREYGKVLGLLHAYACVSTNVKIVVKSSMAKGKNVLVFATRANPTTKENIANVYGARMLSALAPLDLQLEVQRAASQKADADSHVKTILVRGHVSRPVFGEGRQTPDRQMFFVNGRPCGLPQIARAFNEVYKSFNISQSPFIFADFEMDTNAYDVNVSPDKRTIMLHDSDILLDNLKASLTKLFDQEQQTVPQSQVPTSHLQAYKQLKIAVEPSTDSTDSNKPMGVSAATRKISSQDEPTEDIQPLHDDLTMKEAAETGMSDNLRSKEGPLAEPLESDSDVRPRFDGYIEMEESREGHQKMDDEHEEDAEGNSLRDFNQHIAQHKGKATGHKFANPQEPVQAQGSSLPLCKPPPQAGAVQTAFDRVRPSRPAPEAATITVGNKTITTTIGSHSRSSNPTTAEVGHRKINTRPTGPQPTQAFTQRLKDFVAPRTQAPQIDLEPRAVEDSSENAQVTSDSDEVETDMNSSTPAGEDVDPTGTGLMTVSRSMDSAGSPEYSSDEGIINETEKKAQDNAMVDRLIRAAEETAIQPAEILAKHGNKLVQTGSPRELTTSLQLTFTISTDRIRALAGNWRFSIGEPLRNGLAAEKDDSTDNVESEEARLALTVSKTDFARMQIVGQFNLGFILAVRPSLIATEENGHSHYADELFIVDQHASDEKYNFERLQAETVVSNQRLVRSKQLDLTAVEEEILTENLAALEKNGFLVNVSTSDEEAIGQRCKLISLPLSKEVTFGLEDMEELLHLLAESPGVGQSSTVPRPSKVRKMFAMRACRSSIMIGKTLTESKMRTVISHMGEIDKPWNCPHGRPTMRHLMTLDSLDTWQEGDGTTVGRRATTAPAMSAWRSYLQ